MAKSGADRARDHRERLKTGEKAPIGRPKSEMPRKPKGPAKTKSAIIAAIAMAEGITPLEVMLRAMRNAWNAGDEQTAVARAKDAAPYVHPRLAATEVTGKDGGAVKFEHVTDEDRVAALASFMARTGAALPKPKETEH